MSDFENIDVAIRDLQEGLPGWLETPLAEKIQLLESARHRLGREAEGMVEAACAAQGCAPDGPWIGHQWWALSPFLKQLRAFEEVLGRIAAGKPPLPDSAVHTLPNGQVAVDVFPVTCDVTRCSIHLGVPRAGLDAAWGDSEAGAGRRRPGVPR